MVDSWKVRPAERADGNTLLPGTAMASINIDIDLPEGVEFTGYERRGKAHGFEVSWPWPQKCQCQRCGHEDQARLEQSGKQRVVRHLDVWGQPSFWTYEGVFHRCARCHHRQDLMPPFKRKDTSYTYAFEEHVVRLLIGSTEEDVARRLGISAETVGRIVKNQLQEARTIDPARPIRDVGMDEISLKKRHKLYVTVLTDLTDPERPRLLAVKPGRDEAAGRACLECMTAEQRAQVHSYRVDMGASFNKACKEGLPNARGVADRFHVAKLWNETLDGLRKKNHAGAQGEAVASGAEGILLVNVGDASRSAEPDGRGPTEAGEAVRADTRIADSVRSACTLQDDLRHGAESAASSAGPDRAIHRRHGSLSGIG
jgi:transposase